MRDLFWLLFSLNLTQLALYYLCKKSRFHTIPSQRKLILRVPQGRFSFINNIPGLRLLGIGRNEYLELVAKARSLGRRGRSRAVRSLLPRVPLNVPMQPWWRIELGYVLEEDVKVMNAKYQRHCILLFNSRCPWGNKIRH